MFTSEAVGVAARSLLGRGNADEGRVRGESEIWCSAMLIDEDKERRAASPAIDPVCGKLRAHFDGVTRTPMPDQLELLAEQLDAALERGELRCKDE